MNTVINFLGCFVMSEFVLCISLVLGTPRQKKGNEGQTENIRIIEISGKIFCVPSEVMTLAYARLADKHRDRGIILQNGSPSTFHPARDTKRRRVFQDKTI